MLVVVTLVGVGTFWDTRGVVLVVLCRYVCAVSNAHNVAAQGKWVAIVSTQVDHPDQPPEAELALGW
jgi:uncharacterized lipoprotein NlpE involved in copper resistance